MSECAPFERVGHSRVVSDRLSAKRSSRRATVDVPAESRKQFSSARATRAQQLSTAEPIPVREPDSSGGSRPNAPGGERGPQALQRRARRLGPAVGVARELHRGDAVEADLEQRVERGREVEVALAEHAVHVLAGLAIVELDEHEPRGVAADDVGDRQVAGRVAVAEVEAQAELVAVAPEPLDELDVARRALDEHPGLGLERDLHALGAAAREHRAEALAQAPPELLARFLALAPLRHRAVRRRAGPQREDGGPEVRGEVHVPQQELHAALALSGIVVEQVRPVLPGRIEQVPRTALERELEAELLRPRPHPRDLLAVEAEGIELAHVGRDRERLVAEPGHELERVEHAVVREPVRVVAEAEHADQVARAGPARTPPLVLSCFRWPRTPDGRSRVDERGSSRQWTRRGRVTMTRNEQVAWLPAASVAVQETVVVPLGKKLPEGGMQTTLGAGPHGSLVVTWK